MRARTLQEERGDRVWELELQHLTLGAGIAGRSIATAPENTALENAVILHAARAA